MWEKQGNWSFSVKPLSLQPRWQTVALTTMRKNKTSFSFAWTWQNVNSQQRSRLEVFFLRLFVDYWVYLSRSPLFPNFKKPSWHQTAHAKISNKELEDLLGCRPPVSIRSPFYPPQPQPQSNFLLSWIQGDDLLTLCIYHQRFIDHQPFTRHRFVV